jgi:hypothetical protein
MAWTNEARDKSAQIRALRKKLKEALVAGKMTTPASSVVPKSQSKSIAKKAAKAGLREFKTSVAFEVAAMPSKKMPAGSWKGVEQWLAAAKGFHKAGQYDQAAAYVEKAFHKAREADDLIKRLNAMVPADQQMERPLAQLDALNELRAAMQRLSKPGSKPKKPKHKYVEMKSTHEWKYTPMFS